MDNRGVYFSFENSASGNTWYDYSNEPSIKSIVGVNTIGIFWKSEEIGGTIMSLSGIMNNAMQRYYEADCYPYEDCFDNEIFGFMEIWQNACGEFVFEYPGFTYKYEEGKGFENHYNYLELEVLSQANEVKAKLNGQTQYVETLKEKWLFSYQETKGIMFGALDLGNGAQAYHAKGFAQKVVWRYAEYKNIDYYYAFGSYPTDGGECYYPASSSIGPTGLTECTTPCPLGQYSNGGVCETCRATCGDQYCIDNDTDCVVCDDELCNYCPNTPG